MMVCIYCGEPKLERLGCCGENHWEEAEDEMPCGCRQGECESKSDCVCRMAEEVKAGETLEAKPSPTDRNAGKGEETK